MEVVPLPVSFSTPLPPLPQDVEEPEQLALPLPRPAAPPGTAGINYFSVVCLLRGCAAVHTCMRVCLFGAGISAGGGHATRRGFALCVAPCRARVLGACSVHCAAHCLPRSRVYDALENAPRAVKWYRAALQADPFNYEVGAGLSGEAANKFHYSNGFLCLKGSPAVRPIQLPSGLGVLADAASCHLLGNGSPAGLLPNNETPAAEERWRWLAS